MFSGLSYLLLLVSATTTQAPIGDVATTPIPVQPPAVAAQNGTIIIYLQQYTNAVIQWLDESQIPVGGPVQIATLLDIASLRSELVGMITTANTTLQNNIDKARTDMSTANQAISTSLSTNVAALSSAITTNAAGVSALGNSLQNNLNNLAASLQSTSATLTNNMQNLNSNTTTTLTQLISSSIASTTSTLQASIATKVDVGNLGVIDVRVQQVVLGMVAPNVTNDLTRQLNSKLTNSPTCSCFDPRNLQAVSDTVSGLVTTLNATVVCGQQGLVYNASSGCQWSVTLPDCSSRIASLDPNANAACGLTPGSTKLGATCVASCNQGYGASRTAVYTCGSNGLWSGSLTCPGECQVRA